MKILLLILSLTSLLMSQQYTFLVNKYNKAIELEAKIISTIAHLSINKKEDIKLYIPEISSVESEIYSKLFVLSKSCEDADFVYIKKDFDEITKCKNRKAIFFTNNYKKLLNNNIFIGAFFWSKSRPNIVFIKNRLMTKHILLPNTYQKFIEDFN
ncbi:hypothetical protein CPU12_02715 [Malaciobacter molluscorum LMG 25693]|uniref:Uncharacterized protein n=1 Tax=Malaciobacter molluscorum LMG 25693 TaxID=870501 RepID=A0A2G1DLA1_9BACT|nr:hypothetical protein [Malaciobacter molluscorum]AXX92760.1 hypothetical protein AMOL_1796 [Malaciobacter molluscorum LMG 25693]PHO19174.1 hypothetical protein CPU12_02715 [Malaciobacter molluscorum LMG 25693]RXJ97490.1 hypothetical protein CRV00_01255 [Malaciobacter molluscorum]